MKADGASGGFRRHHETYLGGVVHLMDHGDNRPATFLGARVQDAGVQMVVGGPPIGLLSH
jgi:hypothetical protein